MNNQPVQVAVNEQVAPAQRTPGTFLATVAHLPSFFKLFARLFFDGRVGVFAKLLLMAALAYVVSPIDFLPDIAPVLGQLDDMSLILLAGRAFIGMCPQSVVQEHVRGIDTSGEWRPFAS